MTTIPPNGPTNQQPLNLKSEESEGLLEGRTILTLSSLSEIEELALEKIPFAESPLDLKSRGVSPISASEKMPSFSNAIEEIIYRLIKKKKSNADEVPQLKGLPDELIKEIQSFLTENEIRLFIGTSKEFGNRLISELFQRKLNQVKEFAENVGNLELLRITNQLDKNLEEQIKNKISNFQIFLIQNLSVKDFYSEAQIQFNEIKNDLGRLLKNINPADREALILLCTGENPRHPNECILDLTVSHSIVSLARFYLLSDLWQNDLSHYDFDEFLEHPNDYFKSDSETSTIFVEKFIDFLSNQAESSMKLETKLIQKNSSILRELSKMIETIAKIKNRQSIECAEKLIKKYSGFLDEFQIAAGIGVALQKALEKKITSENAIAEIESLIKISALLNNSPSNVTDQSQIINKSYLVMTASIAFIELGNSERALELATPDKFLLKDKLQIILALMKNGELNWAINLFEMTTKTDKKSTDLLSFYDLIKLNIGLMEAAEKIMIALVRNEEIKRAQSFFKYFNTFLKDYNQGDITCNSFHGDQFLMTLVKTLLNLGDVKEALIFSGLISNQSKIKSITFEYMALKLIDQNNFQEAFNIVQKHFKEMSPNALFAILLALVKKRGTECIGNLVEECVSTGAFEAKIMNQEFQKIIKSPLGKIHEMIQKKELSVEEKEEFESLSSRLSNKEIIELIPLLASDTAKYNDFLFSFVCSSIKKRKLRNMSDIAYCIDILNKMIPIPPYRHFYSWSYRAIALALLKLEKTQCHDKVQAIAKTIEDSEYKEFVLGVLAAHH